MNKKSRREIPLFKTKMIDTHCHIDLLVKQSVNDLLKRCENVTIERLVTIGISPENQSSVLSLTREHPRIYGSLGIHPHEAEKATPEILNMIKRTAQQENKIIAIGEIGLDYHYEYSPRSIQIKIFEEQINIACELQLPIIIHCREADDDLMKILEKYAFLLKDKAVIHSFSSSQELAAKALSYGFYLGFNGMLTFRSAENVRDILKICPLRQILLETDSPYLTPEPYRGKENAPFLIPFIAERAADILEIPIEIFLQHCYDNSMRLFFKKSL